MKLTKKNLSNKYPSKDITQDDKKNKLTISTSNCPGVSTSRTL